MMGEEGKAWIMNKSKRNAVKIKCFKLYIFSEPLLSYDHHQCSAERGDQHQHPSLRHRLGREVERDPGVGGSLRQHTQDAGQP